MSGLNKKTGMLGQRTAEFFNKSKRTTDEELENRKSSLEEEYARIVAHHAEVDSFFAAKEDSALQTDEIAKCFLTLYSDNDVYDTFMADMATAHEANDKTIEKER